MLEISTMDVLRHTTESWPLPRSKIMADNNLLRHRCFLQRPAGAHSHLFTVNLTVSLLAASKTTTCSECPLKKRTYDQRTNTDPAIIVTIF